MKRKLALILVLFTGMLWFLSPATVFAAEGRWVDEANIAIGDEIFTDPNPNDNDNRFFTQDTISENPCPDNISDVRENDTKATLTRHTVGNCSNTSTEEVTFSADSVQNASTAEDDRPESCEQLSGALGWIVCPVILALDSGMNAVDSQIQGLLTVEEKYYDNDGIRSAASNIRGIAFIILVPILLVMVIGTALGFNLIDAYTVKKALPRLFIAVIFISLSYNITVFLIELFNVIGLGALGLMTSPFDNTVDTLSLADLFGGSFFNSIIVLPFVGLGTIMLVWLFITPLFLAAVTAFLFLMLRQIIIVALMLLAPLAILSWIFPGNDKLWKSWWSIFSKLLMLFPLIMVVIAIGRILAFTLMESSEGPNQGSYLNSLMKLGLYMVPYAFIPFSFKYVGGVLGNLSGMINDKERGLLDRARKGRQQKYERAGRRVVQRRADWQNRLQTSASSRSRFSPAGLAQRGLSHAIGGYNIQAADSARRAHVSKELNEQIATGRDDEIRGLTVNKKAALAGGVQAAPSEDGHTYGVSGDFRINQNGAREFRTLGGAWVNEGAVDAGQSRWGNDTYAQQAALSYEMRKAGTEEELQHIANNYATVAQGPWKMTENQAGGAWIGAAFENQNQHLEFKHTDWKTGRINANKAKAFATEVYEKKGSYPLAQMGGNTIKQLKNAYDVGDEETKKKIQSVAETFMYRGGARGITGVEGEGGEGMPIPDPRPPETPVGATPGGPGGKEAAGRAVPEAFFQTNTPGAAAVAERVRDLAVHVGVYQSDLGSPRTTSDGSPPLGRNLPPPDIPRQN